MKRRSNPLTMNTPEKVAIGVGVVGAIAAGIYYATRPAAAPATTPTTTPPTPTHSPAPVNMPGVLLQPGTQTITSPVTGIAIRLPAGAIWTTGIAPVLLGTSDPLTVGPFQAGTHGSSKFTVGWNDSTGAAQSTELTLNY